MRNRHIAVVTLIILLCSSIWLGAVTGADLIKKSNYRLNISYFKNLHRDERAFYTNFMIKPIIKPWIRGAFTYDFLGSVKYEYHDIKLLERDINAKTGFHRLGLRVYDDKLEFVIGKQKINFGEAQVLRVVDWYDTVNYFDISSYTKGTVGALLKVYPDMESAVWGWYNITNTYESNEIIKLHDADKADFGFRYERDFNRVSSGISFENIGRERKENQRFKGRKIALDLKADAFLGLWTEAQQYFVDDFPGMQETEREQTSVMAGADYTFPLGNGLYTMAEYRITSLYYDSSSQLKKGVEDICLVMDYPISIMYSNMFSVSYHQTEFEDYIPELSIMHSLKFTEDLYIINLQTYLSYNDYDEKPELGVQISFLADY